MYTNIITTNNNQSQSSRDILGSFGTPKTASVRLLKWQSISQNDFTMNFLRNCSFSREGMLTKCHCRISALPLIFPACQKKAVILKNVPYNLNKEMLLAGKLDNQQIPCSQQPHVINCEQDNKYEAMKYNLQQVLVLYSFKIHCYRNSVSCTSHLLDVQRHPASWTYLI